MWRLVLAFSFGCMFTFLFPAASDAPNSSKTSPNSIADSGHGLWYCICSNNSDRMVCGFLVVGAVSFVDVGFLS